MAKAPVDPRVNFPTFTPASGSQYLPRHEIERSIWQSLRTGMHVIVSGPRRSGKTSLLQSVRQQGVENQDLWSDKESFQNRVVCFVDAQHPQPERFLCDRLADVLPEGSKPTAALLTRSANPENEALRHYLHEVLKAFQAEDISVLLLIDEVDLPLQRTEPDLWRDFLNRLFRDRNIHLVVTTDALNLDQLGIRGWEHNRARIRQIDLHPWSEDEIRTLIRRAVKDEWHANDVAAISAAIAPAWPLEVMLVIHHLVEEGVPEPSQIESLLDDKELNEYGHALLIRALSRLNRSETKTAMELLSSIATPTASSRENSAAKREGKSENLATWLPIARILAQAGIVALSGRLIAAATPVMQRAVLSFLGR